MRWPRLEKKFVARAAAAQEEGTIDELPTKDIPTEISPLVTAVEQAAYALARCLRFRNDASVQDAARRLRTPITAMTMQLKKYLKSYKLDAEATAQVAQVEAGLKRTKQ